MAKYKQFKVFFLDDWIEVKKKKKADKFFSFVAGEGELKKKNILSWRKTILEWKERTKQMNE